MKRRKILVMALASCTIIGGMLKMGALAATPCVTSTGNFVTDDGKMAFYGSDISYLSYELSSLRSEIDYSIFDMASSDGTVISSTDRRHNLIKSHGIIDYDNGKVVISSIDLLNLADAIDGVENDYIAMTSTALNNIGTYFDTDGNVNHESPATDSIMLGRGQLIDGIFQSQSVDHLAAAPVIADNITAGAAAWVNGKCIIGNGADNERAYQRGIDDGKAGNVEDVDIQYTYHAHTGNSGKNPIPDGDVYYSTSNPGGCYIATGHTHDATGTCGTKKVSRTKECGCTAKYDEHVYTGDNCYYCGHPHFGRDGVYPDKCTATTTITTTEYTCGSPTNTWEIGCGMKAGQKESAEVIIHTRKETHEGT